VGKIRTNSRRWELGSEFHWAGLPEPPFRKWPAPAVWLMLARHAVAALVQLKSADSPTLWLPSYFCPEVADCCSSLCPIREYRDLPQWSEPDWKSLLPGKHDIVVAVNYFGARTREPWGRWRERTDCVLVEDHSQDPFSPWALNSTADFAFASARKTLPIADGALLWSPRGLPLPNQPNDGDWSGAALKVAALMFKAEYLSGRGPDSLKGKFRQLQLRGEDLLRRSEVSCISPGSFAYVADGVPEAWPQQRKSNARYLHDRLLAIGCVTPLFKKWPEGATPFVVPLVFPSQPERDGWQSALQKRNIYCPVHWICKTSHPEALALSQTMLSLPVDQRYDRDDMECIARALREAAAVMGFLREAAG